MLALCDRNIKAPDDLTVEKTLYIEKTQLPLALIQASDEEMVIFTQSISQNDVLIIFISSYSECGREESIVM